MAHFTLLSTNTTTESDICSRPDFPFVQGIFPLVQMMAFVLVGATNWYKFPITEARRVLIHLT
jgi:hypothetical protein